MGDRDFIPLDQVRDGRRVRAPNTGYAPPRLPGNVNLGGLQGKPIPPRRWLVDQWVPLGTVTMLGGDGGTGKSILALQLLAAAALGKSWLGQPTMRCKALGVFCEDSADELHRRMADVLAHYEVNFADLEDLTLFSLFGEENALLDFDQETRKWVESERYFQIGRAIEDSGAQLIVLDSLHDLFAGNENSRPEARRFIQMLAAWARDYDAAVVLNAHPSLSGLNSGTGTSGSTAWNNAVRSRLYLTRLETTDGDSTATNDVRELRRVKANYAGAGDRLALRWKDGVFVAEAAQGGVLAAIRRDQAEQTFLACLKAIEVQGRTVCDAATSPRYAPKVFSALPEANGHSKRDLEGAMNRLFSAGIIRVGKARGVDRHPINAIIRTESGGAGSAGATPVSP